jgi:hypothetical protein
LTLSFSWLWRIWRESTIEVLKMTLWIEAVLAPCDKEDNSGVVSGGALG